MASAYWTLKRGGLEKPSSLPGYSREPLEPPVANVVGIRRLPRSD